MCYYQIAYKLDVIGIAAAFIFQCRPFLISFLTKNFTIIDDTFKIRKIYRNDAPSSFMLIISISELYSIYEIYYSIQINLSYLLCLTSCIPTLFMIHEIVYDIFIVSYVLNLTDKQRENLLMNIKSNKCSGNDLDAKNKDKSCSCFDRINDIKLDDWDNKRELHNFAFQKKIDLDNLNETNKMKRLNKWKKNIHINKSMRFNI